MLLNARRRSATIHDVAETAGVAVGTVSRYLNGQAVRAGNRAEIEKAIATLSFQRSAVAKAMKSDTTNVIGFLVPTFDEFHAGLLTQLVRAFRQSGQSIMTYCHDNDSKLLREAMAYFANQRVDALVLAGSGGIEIDTDMLVERGIPVTVYNNDVMGLHVDRVFVENTKTSYRAVQHLLDVGYTRIATVVGFQSETAGAHRLDGYRLALESRGIAFNPAYVHPGDWVEEGGYAALQHFMALAEPPEAIFSANYRMTFGILEWIREHGLKVPDDLALISFDDVELFRLYDSGITAVAQPIEKVAQSIAGYVRSRLSGEALPDIRTRMLDCDIVLRGSSAPRRRSIAHGEA